MKAYLEHFPEQGGPAKRVEITKTPFLIGRSRTADLTIYSHKVSKDHAAIAMDSEQVSGPRSQQHQWNLRQRQAESTKSLLSTATSSTWLTGNSASARDPPIGPRAYHTASMTQETDMREKVSLIRLITSFGNWFRRSWSAIHFQPIVELRNQRDRRLRGPGPGKSSSVASEPRPALSARREM